MSRTYDYTREQTDPQEQDFSDPLVLDRHRIVHSMAFRRLQYKTQVFLPLEADHFRTRLTHTLEVAQMGIYLSGRFGGNAALVELICLAHDLGHGPFGHAGERALDELVKDFGGFEHNDQSLRVVRYLERPYPYFVGLNLTQAVLTGLEAHAGRYDRDWSVQSGNLESQLSSWADRLAYDAGDLEDALGAELLGPESLEPLRLWQSAAGRIDPELLTRPVGAIRRILCEALQQTVIDGLQVKTLTDCQEQIELSSQIDDDLTELEEFLADEVYRHPKVARADDACQKIISRIFEKYRREPDLLPERYLRRQQHEPLERIIADFISGMTDRFCLKVYRQMYGGDDNLLNSLDTLKNIGS